MTTTTTPRYIAGTDDEGDPAVLDTWNGNIIGFVDTDTRKLAAELNAGESDFTTYAVTSTIADGFTPYDAANPVSSTVSDAAAELREALALHADGFGARAIERSIATAARALLAAIGEGS